METLYIIPTGCPHEAVMVASNAWGQLGPVKQSIFEALSPRKGIQMESRYNRKLWISWTCAGCTVGLGEQEDCLPRQCGLGGKRDLE